MTFDFGGISLWTYTKYVNCEIKFIKLGQNICLRFTKYIKFGLSEYIHLNTFYREGVA